MKNQICSQTRQEDFRVGKPIPLEQVTRPHFSRLKRWLDVLKSIPPGMMVEVRKDPNTVRHVLNRLVEEGYIQQGDYIKRVVFWARLEKRRVYIIHLPRDKEERERVLKDLEARS